MISIRRPFGFVDGDNEVYVYSISSELTLDCLQIVEGEGGSGNTRFILSSNSMFS